MIKRLKSAICFGMMVATLASCSQEENVPLNEMKGDLVILKVDFDGIEEIQPEGASTRSASTGPRTHIEELGGDLVLETSVVADVAEVSEQTKAVSRGVSDMVTGTRVAAIVYKKNGTPYKLQQMVKGSAELHLPLGEEFRIVFYSYNSAVEPKVQVTGTTSPDGNGGLLLSPNATVEINNENRETNVMWGRIDDTGKISQTTKLQNIVFTPVFNQLSWELSTTGSTLFKITGAEIQNTFESAKVNMNILRTATDKLNVWEGVGNVSTALIFTPNAGMKVTSTRKQFIANPTMESKLSAQIEIAGASKTIGYSLGNLERGVRYKVISKLTTSSQRYSIALSTDGPGTIDKSGMQEGAMGDVIVSTARPTGGATFDGWYKDGQEITAGSNADETVSGSTLSVKLTAATNGKSYVAKFSGDHVIENGVAAPRIYVVGVGDNATMELTKSPNNNGSHFQFGSIIAWRNTGSAVQQFNPTTISTSWDSSWRGSSTHSLANLKNGMGDPCRLVGYTQKFVKDELSANRIPDNKKWKTPSSAENKLFGTVAQPWTQVNGIYGRYFGDQFLPAAGFRYYSDGVVHAQGSNGYYCSSSVASADRGYCLRFNSSDVRPEGDLTQATALSVRCVPQ